MKNYIIITDETAGIPIDIDLEQDVVILNMPCVVDAKVYNETNPIDIVEYYKLLRQGKVPKTSQINVSYVEKIFREYLEKNLDIIYFSFSSGMSGSYENVHSMATNLEKEYPGNKIRVVDTLSGAGGEGLLVYYAFKMKQRGKTIEELEQWVNDNRLNTHHYFIIRDITFLAKGGRISLAKALVGEILQINPILSLNVAGKITPVGKVVGRKKALREMISYLQESYIPEMNEYILIEHGDCLEDAEAFAEQIQRSIPDVQFKFGYVNKVVGSHAGAESLAVFFLGKKRKK